VGLFKELALLPLAPVRGTAWIAEQLAEEADRQLYDENRIKRELVQLEFDQEEGRIGEKERAEKEAELLERLAVARERAAEDAEDARQLAQVEGPANTEEYEVSDRG
jgi:Gas vesicle protein G